MTAADKSSLTPSSISGPRDSLRLSVQKGNKRFQLAVIPTSVSPGVSYNVSSSPGPEEMARLIDKASEFKRFGCLDDVSVDDFFPHLSCGK